MIYSAFVAMKCSVTRLSDILAKHVINGLTICEAVDLHCVYYYLNFNRVAYHHEWKLVIHIKFYVPLYEVAKPLSKCPCQHSFRFPL